MGVNGEGDGSLFLVLLRNGGGVRSGVGRGTGRVGGGGRFVVVAVVVIGLTVVVGRLEDREDVVVE